MDTNLILTIILLFVILLLLLVVCGLIAFIYFKSKNNQNSLPPVASDKNIQFGPNDFKKIFDEQRKKDEPIMGLCAICEKDLIKSDCYEIDKLHFCREHFDLYTKQEWEPITNQLTTGETPEAGIYIYNFKRNSWIDDKEPMYIQCEYKIDVINDQIETYVQLHVIKERAELLKNKLEKIKV